MSVAALLEEFAQADIRLWVEDGQLRFSAPRGAMTASRRQAIADHKPQLLALLECSFEVDGPRARGHGDGGLSHAQERLWFLEHYEGPSGLYNEGRASLMTGPLSLEHLQTALERVVHRHPVLRTAYPADANGQPQVVIQSRIKPRIALIDWTADRLELETGRQRALDLLSQESQRPFDLASGPLFRCLLVRLSHDCHVLGIFMHHMICDGLSLALVCAELTTAYSAASEDREPDFPPLTLDYQDYAVWQRGETFQARSRRDLDFWSEQLADVTPLSFAAEPAADGGNQGAIHRFQLPAADLGRIDRLARTLGSTVFVMLTAAFQLLLRLQTERRDVVLSTPVTERRHAVLQPMIGFFVNSVVLRQSVTDEAPVRDYLSAAHDTAQRAMRHQYAPYDQVIDAVGRRHGDRQAVARALSQVRMVYLDGMIDDWPFHDLQVTPLPVNRRLAKFDLMLTIERGREGAEADFEYRTACFEGSDMAALAAEYQQLLTLLPDALEQPVEELLRPLSKARAERQHARRDAFRTRRQQGLMGLRKRAANG